MNSDGTLGSGTGFSVYANQPSVFTELSTGSYAIVIGSADGSARGSYKMNWNSSNPVAQSIESALLSENEDLSRIVIHYKGINFISLSP